MCRAEHEVNELLCAGVAAHGVGHRKKGKDRSKWGAARDETPPGGERYAKLMTSTKAGQDTKMPNYAQTNIVQLS